MKNLLLTGAAAIALAAGVPAFAAADAAPATVVVSNNVLLKEWTGPYGGVPPWDQVKPELFPEAFQVGIDQLLAETDAIANNTAYPSFENTIEAMEKSGRTLDRVQALFGVMTDNMSTPAYQALDKEWSPKLSAAYDKINLNSKLFARIATVYEHRDHVGLDAKQMRLLTRTYEGFVRRGAKLNDAQKAQLSGYNQQLATDFSEFNSRLLADEATFTQASEADMAGVQQDVKDAAAGVAKAKGLPAGTYAIRNTRSAVEPVLSFGTNRALREKVWRAFVNRGDARNVVTYVTYLVDREGGFVVTDRKDSIGFWSILAGSNCDHPLERFGA